MISQGVDIGVETGIAELCGVRFSTPRTELVALGWTMAEHDQPVRSWNQSAELTRTTGWLGRTCDIRILTPSPLHVDLWPPDDLSDEAQLLALLKRQFGPPSHTHSIPRWTLVSGLKVSLEEDVVVISPPNP